MPQTAATIDILRNKRGWFSMLAIDQRESLRAMLARDGVPAGDDQLVAFKSLVTRELTPHASAVLIDRDYGAQAASESKCPVILAADVLSASVPGGPIDKAELDEGLTDDVIDRFDAAALKMLVPWLPDHRDEAVELSARFLEFCRTVGLPGVVEGVVRPHDIATWSAAERNDALVEAARDLGATGPDLYKAEVPQYGGGDLDEITAVAQRITDSISAPWVVLSSGVPAPLFLRSVELCVAGGASGFLAGRAIWADATRSDQPEQFLETESVSRLQSLTAVLNPPGA